ncbi:penicillin-binding transpeptidase domain-containing protein [Tomitella biformata]|uniref:penicillin-binding transpeptidase domain-containing protein n=1 Tax=Tomitella biformata TaxID=630403 RepID=UPI0004657B31|nr:penicillin-binding transpeptidase domain-containing protein [Tomitella biformata]
MNSHRLTRLGLTLLVAILGLSLVSCGSRPDVAQTAAQDFIDHFANQDLDAAAAATDAPNTARTVLADAWGGLQAESLTAKLGAMSVVGDTATVEYTYEWRLPKERVWSYSGELGLIRQGGQWEVRWNSTAVHPRLGAGQTMALRTSAPPRAPVIGHDGAPLMVPGISVQVLLNAKEAGNLRNTVDTLTRTLQGFDPSITPQTLAERATSTTGFYAITRITAAQAEQVRGQLELLPGVRLVEQPDLIVTDPMLDNDIVRNVKDIVLGDIDGAAGWRVVTVNQDGVDVDLLTETAAKPAPAVSVSLDKLIQTSAQAAVRITDKPAMLVAIQPSTGQILAVAQNEAADQEGPIALTGMYPPGSTFKIITAGAAISGGLAGPGSPLSCPGEIVIRDRTVPNYAGFALGGVSMATAFAASCNTTFAELASRMEADALPTAAAQFGIGVDYDVRGLRTMTGSVQAAEDIVQRAEDGFGQGRDLASPFGMALTAATVANGRTPVPQLISGHETTVTGDPGVITPEMVDGLREMMRQVVTSGTGTRIADQGAVFGKTGEAEFDGGSHAWFAGYRGDIAFAALIVDGGSSDNAVAVSREMLIGLPDGYMAD